MATETKLEPPPKNREGDRDAKWGRERDDTRRIHPDLVPWDQLEDDVKESDRRTVRGLPAFLAEAGYRVYRLREEGSGG